MRSSDCDVVCTEDQSVLIGCDEDSWRSCFGSVCAGVERELLGSDGSAGSHHSAVWPEEEQQRQQLQRQPYLDLRSASSTRLPPLLRRTVACHSGSYRQPLRYPCFYPGVWKWRGNKEGSTSSQCLSAFSFHPWTLAHRRATVINLQGNYSSVESVASV